MSSTKFGLVFARCPRQEQPNSGCVELNLGRGRPRLALFRPKCRQGPTSIDLGSTMLALDLIKTRGERPKSG